MVVGSLVMAGWVLDLGLLKIDFPGRHAMYPSSGAAIILGGAALRLLMAEPLNHRAVTFARICASTVLLIGLLELLLTVSGKKLGLLRPQPERDPSYESSLLASLFEPTTAVGLILLGGLLLLLDNQTKLVSGSSGRSFSCLPSSLSGRSSPTPTGRRQSAVSTGTCPCRHTPHSPSICLQSVYSVRGPERG